MNKEEIYEKLNEIFQDIFDDENITVKAETTADDIADWDSLEHINLITGIEKTFNMKFKMKDVVGMKNVGDMVEIIEKEAKI